MPPGRRPADAVRHSPLRRTAQTAQTLSPCTQVRQSLLLGCLQEGGRLPTVKDVAASLVINPNTIVKAYRHLEHGARPTIGRARECRQARRLRGDVQDCAWQPLVLARLRITLNQA